MRVKSGAKRFFPFFPTWPCTRLKKKERSHGALRILSLFYFVVQIKKVNFKAGDKVGEGDIMVEIEHHPDH